MHPIRELQTSEWPVQLREIPQLPRQLWIRGNLPPQGTLFLTVVGSRALTHYGESVCSMLIEALRGYPISIVSGLALGADACAHRSALRAGLHTIAIPGSGIDDSVIGPRTNLPLAHDILASGGALISEQAPTHTPRKGEFPSRNRLMVGLSHAVLMIEAGEKSGTLITARLASEYNRDLLTIPHRIGDIHAFGPHLFARLGAALVTEPLHILEALRITPDVRAETASLPPDVSDTERTVWEALESAKTRDEILRAYPHAAGEVLTALVALELRGLIKEEFGTWRRA